MVPKTFALLKMA